MNYEKKIYLFVLVSALLLIFTNCNSSTSDNPQIPSGPFVCASTPVTKGSRQFGMDILDVPSVGSYSDSLANLKTLGGQFQTLHLNWNQIEAAGSGITSGAFADPSNAMSALNALAISDGIKVTLRIHPVDIPGKYVPSDLTAMRFNHATLKTRAKAMLNFVFTRISPANMTHLIMGNEIDGYNPGADTNFWLDYADFLFEMNAHLITNFPSVKIGFVITSRGATDATLILPSSGNQRAVDIFAGWMGTVDLLGITYYPLSTSLQMKPNSEVAALFQNLVAFTNKPIHIEEVGYSSSTTTAGSDSLQAEFFCEVIKAWDSHAAKIPSLSILRMVDKTRTDAESVANTYGLAGNENFIEYIRSLGIRTTTNQAKESFTLLDSELQKRGF